MLFLTYSSINAMQCTAARCRRHHGDLNHLMVVAAAAARPPQRGGDILLSSESVYARSLV